MDEEISEGTMKLDTVDCLKVNVLTWWVAVFELFFFWTRKLSKVAKTSKDCLLSVSQPTRAFHVILFNHQVHFVRQALLIPCLPSFPLK